jgi:hypothetical protein
MYIYGNAVPIINDVITQSPPPCTLCQCAVYVLIVVGPVVLETSNHMRLSLDILLAFDSHNRHVTLYLLELIRLRNISFKLLSIAPDSCTSLLWRDFCQTFCQHGISLTTIYRRAEMNALRPGE